MDLDSTLSVVVVAVSLAAYFAVSVLDAGVGSWRNRQLLLGPAPSRRRRDGDESQGFVPSPKVVESMRAVRAVTFAASLVAAVALTVSVVEVSWPWITVAAVLALVFLSALGSAARALAPASSALVGRFGDPGLSVLSGLLAPWLAAEAMVAAGTRRLLPERLRTGRAGIGGDGATPLGFEGEVLDEREVRMIRAIVRQDKTVAREIMVPRVDMSAVQISTSIPEVARRMIESGHSKLPVYRDTLDQVAGFVYAMDLIRVLGADGAVVPALDDVLRPPLLIPESKTLEGLLREFQDQRVQMAVVVDEYGGVSGVVTIEDLLEEIVGEIEDEFDVDEPEVVDLTRGAEMEVGTETGPERRLDLLIDARISVDQVAELTGVSVDGEGFDTLGGFVLDRLGRIPGLGDTVDHDGLRILVVSTSGRRLKRLRVTRGPKSDQ